MLTFYQSEMLNSNKITEMIKCPVGIDWIVYTLLLVFTYL